ncbi:Alcohol dehydrogenase superfamily, zinc-type [Niveomyces insectorum RCEF 264]|uniref:Alcohol dehydrogenase superfamily, zinc-type n=1 Tax=Niveomyces insectorum RCEF 264 TaxID=1081102 RepID=A0A167RC85_9HYPO|nr:Alcohol dehydrogenase superfamily, zinc-type [Niveomyces insectorum RCEF 264]
MASDMLAVVALKFTDPSGYQLSTVPRPAITDKDHVLIRVHAASINPVDVKKANGAFKPIVGEAFPYKIGYDAAGTVEATGTDVARLKAGDEVFVRLPETGRGSWSEYVTCPERFIARKPKTLSFGDAASLPLAGVTALQALRKYPGSLEGKTVLVTAGLSGTGAFACQLAKNVFRAGKVITTVSTAKIPKVPTLLGEGVVDQIVDYTKEDPAKAIPRGSVDFFFDTTGQAMQFLCLMVPRTGQIVSISTMPSGATVQASEALRRPDHPRMPLLIRLFLDAADAVLRLRAWRWGVAYQYIFLEPNGEDLTTLATYVDDGKLKPIVGARVDFRAIEAVREACMATFQGKGIVGKTVIDVIKH